MLGRAPELKVEISGIVDLRTVPEYVVQLTKHLWHSWNVYLTERGILPNDLYRLLLAKFSEDTILKWLRKEITWQTLLDGIIKQITSSIQEFHFVFKLKPESAFGLPEGKTIVLPAKEVKELVSPVADVWVGKLVSHGTLPQYRQERHKLFLEKEIDGVKFRFDDNFMHIWVLSEESKGTLETAMGIANNVVHLLTLFYGVREDTGGLPKHTSSTRFTYDIVLGEDQYGRSIRLPSPLFDMKGVFYDIEALNMQIAKCTEYQKIMDDLNLRKSLQYFYHALFLDSIRGEAATAGFATDTECHMYLLSDIIMNLHKGVSVIVGDPSKDKDYQRRYKEYGIDYEFWKERIEDLRHVRNDWDVAHYDLDKEKLENLNTKTGNAIDVTRKVILKYIEHKEHLLSL